MKVAVMTCNLGSIDEIYPLIKQSYPYELFYYTENTLPFPLPNLDNRMKGKYFKTQAHKFLDHDVFIWIDGSIEVINEDFVKDMVYELEFSRIIVEPHKQRPNVYKELEYIIDKMKEGDRYLLKRYVKQPLYQEYEFYRKMKMPKDYPLYQCSFFARKNDPDTNTLFNHWWDLILRYSNFDQTQFSFALWDYQVKVNTIETKDYFIRNKHNGYNL